MNRNDAVAGLLTLFSILFWLGGIALMSFGQSWSACFMFVGAGLLLVWPVINAVTACECPECRPR